MARGMQQGRGGWELIHMAQQGTLAGKVAQYFPIWKGHSASPSLACFTPNLSSPLASGCSGAVVVQVMLSRAELWPGDV